MIDGKNREKKADNRRRESFRIRSRTSVILKKKRQTSHWHTSLCPEAKRGLIGPFVCPSDAWKRRHKHILLIRPEWFILQCSEKSGYITSPRLSHVLYPGSLLILRAGTHTSWPSSKGHARQPVRQTHTYTFAQYTDVTITTVETNSGKGEKHSIRPRQKKIPSFTCT